MNISIDVLFQVLDQENSENISVSLTSVNQPSWIGAVCSAPADELSRVVVIYCYFMNTPITISSTFFFFF